MVVFVLNLHRKYHVCSVVSRWFPPGYRKFRGHDLTLGGRIFRLRGKTEKWELLRTIFLKEDPFLQEIHIIKWTPDGRKLVVGGK